MAGRVGVPARPWAQRRRALTLLEVLAATVLLAAVAALVSPLLSDLRRSQQVERISDQLIAARHWPGDELLVGAHIPLSQSAGWSLVVRSAVVAEEHRLIVAQDHADTPIDPTGAWQPVWVQVVDPSGRAWGQVLRLGLSVDTQVAP